MVQALAKPKDVVHTVVIKGSRFADAVQVVELNSCVGMRKECRPRGQAGDQSPCRKHANKDLTWPRKFHGR